MATAKQIKAIRPQSSSRRSLEVPTLEASPGHLDARPRLARPQRRARAVHRRPADVDHQPARVARGCRGQGAACCDSCARRAGVGHLPERPGAGGAARRDRARARRALARRGPGPSGPSDHLGAMTARQRATRIDSAERQLVAPADSETRHRKRMQTRERGLRGAVGTARAGSCGYTMRLTRIPERLVVVVRGGGQGAESSAGRGQGIEP